MKLCSQPMVMFLSFVTAVPLFMRLFLQSLHFDTAAVFEIAPRTMCTSRKSFIVSSCVLVVVHKHHYFAHLCAGLVVSVVLIFANGFIFPPLVFCLMFLVLWSLNVCVSSSRSSFFSRKHHSPFLFLFLFPLSGFFFSEPVSFARRSC